MLIDRERVFRVFCAALDLPDDERPAYLDSECGADPDLRREVESLLTDSAEEAVRYIDELVKAAR